jgi:hypothetical protein
MNKFKLGQREIGKFKFFKFKLDTSMDHPNATDPGALLAAPYLDLAPAGPPAHTLPGIPVATAQAIQRMADAGAAKARAATTKKTKNRKRSQKARWTKEEVRGARLSLSLYFSVSVSLSLSVCLSVCLSLSLSRSPYLSLSPYLPISLLLSLSICFAPVSATFQ